MGNLVNLVFILKYFMNLRSAPLLLTHAHFAPLFVPVCIHYTYNKNVCPTNVL